MNSVSHKKSNGLFVNEEANEKAFKCNYMTYIVIICYKTQLKNMPLDKSLSCIWHLAIFGKTFCKYADQLFMLTGRASCFLNANANLHAFDILHMHIAKCKCKLIS